MKPAIFKIRKHLILAVLLVFVLLTTSGCLLRHHGLISKNNATMAIEGGNYTIYKLDKKQNKWVQVSTAVITPEHAKKQYQAEVTRMTSRGPSRKQYQVRFHPLRGDKFLIELKLKRTGSSAYYVYVAKVERGRLTLINGLNTVVGRVLRQALNYTGTMAIFSYSTSSSKFDMHVIKKAYFSDTQYFENPRKQYRVLVKQ